MESIQEKMKEQLASETFQSRYDALVKTVLNNADVQQFIAKNEIADTIVQANYAKLFEFVTEKERFLKTGDSQNKGFEPRLIFTGYSIEVSYAPTEQFLEEQEKRMVLNRIQTFEMPKNIQTLTLEQIELTQYRRELFLYFKSFIQQLKDDCLAKGAYLYGSFGVGKTHLLGSLAGTLAKEGYSSYLAHVPSLVVELKAAIATNQVGEKIETIKKAPILMLDDIGGETMTNWVRDDVFMVILDYRMRENLPTFFTSNLSFEHLEQHFATTTTSEDERKAKRLMERVKFLATPFELKGSNRR